MNQRALKFLDQWTRTPGSPESSPSQKLRVAVITANLGLAGAEKQAFYIARALAGAGVDVRVWNLARGGEYQDALRRLHIPAHWFGWLPGLPLRLLVLLAGLRRFRPHVIQSVHAYTNIYSALAGRILGAVSLGGLRSDLGSCFADNGRFSRYLLTWPDAIAVNSKKAQAQVQQARLLDPGRLHFLPNAIDLETFPERAPAAGRACTCIYVGRLFPFKRVDVFIRALAMARASDPSIRGIVAGYGPQEAALQRLAAEAGLGGGSLTFLGFRDDVPQIIQQASIFVFCSESEGTPNVILEAMAAGLPVITTPAGDAADVVQPAGAGYVVPFGDVEATARAMLRLAKSPVLRAKLGRAGRSYVAHQRSTSELAARLIGIYAGVARTTTRRGGPDLLNRLSRCPE